MWGWDHSVGVGSGGGLPIILYLKSILIILGKVQDKCTEIGCELMYHLAFSPLTNPIKHPSRGMKFPLRRNKSSFTLHGNPESLCCLTHRGPYAGQISADYVCSSLYKRGNERRALTMGSAPTKENMESRFTLLLFSLHNERTADGWFLSDLFVWDTRETSIFFQEIQTLVSGDQEKRRRKGDRCYMDLLCSLNHKDDRRHTQQLPYWQVCQDASIPTHFTKWRNKQVRPPVRTGLGIVKIWNISNMIWYNRSFSFVNPLLKLQ